MLGTGAKINQIRNKVIDQFVVLQNSLLILNVLTFRGRIVWWEFIAWQTLGKSPKVRKLIFHGFPEASKAVSVESGRDGTLESEILRIGL